MKKILTAAFLLSTNLFANEPISVNDFNYELVRNGYDTEKERFTDGICIDVQPGGMTNPTTGKASFNLSQSLDQKERDSAFGFSAGAKWRTGVTKYSLGAKFVKNSSSSNFSISSTYNSTYQYAPRIIDTSKADWNALGKSLLNNPERLKIICGDKFVYKQFFGGKLFFNIRVDFDSQKSKEEFEANFSLKGPATEVTANLRSAKNSFSKRTKVTVSAIQVGGDISKVTEIISGKHEVTGDSGYAFKECSFGNLSECEKVLQRAIDYATNTTTGFPSQIENNFEKAELLKIAFKGYGAFVGYPDYSPQLEQASLNARNTMNDHFEKLLVQQGNIRSINNGIVRLSKRQDKLFKEHQVTIDKRVDLAVKNIEHCYNNLLTCYDDFLNTMSEAPLFDNEELRPGIESFARVCDMTRSSGDSNQKYTVDSVMEFVKNKYPNRFVPITPGEYVDDCGIAENIILETNELDLSNLDIIDYSPILHFKDLVKLNLSGNNILDLSFLNALPNLEILNLSNNYISDASPLTRLKELKDLDLSNNKLRDVSSLNNLTKLFSLDLRNNSSLSICPENIPDCISIDYSNLVTISPKFKGDDGPSRKWHSTISIGDKVIILGGAQGGEFYKTKVEMFDEFEDFSTIGNMKKGREYFTTHHLKNGDILAIGGLDPEDHSEVINVQDFSITSTLKKMHQSRYGHSSIELENGNILVTGGFAPHGSTWTDTNVLSSAEIYNIYTGKFERIPNMNQARSGHTMTLIGGKVLIVGGMVKGIASNTAEIYDPATNRFAKIESRLFYSRGYHTATKLNDGEILIIGGYSSNNGKGISVVEVYNQTRKTFETLDYELNHARGGHRAFALKNGQILVAGGRIDFSARSVRDDTCKERDGTNSRGEVEAIIPCLTSFEIVDSRNRRSTLLNIQMQVPRSGESMIQYGDNKILILGGNHNAYDYLRASVLNF